MRADPRARLLATLVVSAVALAASRPAGLALPLAALAALHLASGSGAGSALASLRPFRVLFLFTIAMQLAFTPGDPLWEGVLPERLTREGGEAALLALGRLAVVVAASAHLVATTSPLELARGVGWAISPLARVGVPVRDVTLVMALAFRFVPVLVDEGRALRSALESRGVSVRHPALRPRLRALLVWVLAVLFGMLDRSARLAAALETKGFTLPGAFRHRFAPWTREGSGLLAASALLAAAAILAR